MFLCFTLRTSRYFTTNGGKGFPFFLRYYMTVSSYKGDVGAAWMGTYGNSYQKY